jgi:hypothetical protein
MVPSSPHGPCKSGKTASTSPSVWGTELGKGNSHSFDKIPFVVAGGAGGKLQTGRYLQFDGVEHNRLLVSIAQLMGMQDMATFGGTDTKTGTLPGFM